MSGLDTKAANEYAILLTFIYDLTTVRYVVGQNPITISSETFSPMPILAVKLPQEDGGLEVKHATIRCTKTVDPFTIYQTAEPAPDMTVKIEEVDINDAVATRRVLLLGRVTKAILNSGRRPNQIEVQVGSPKTRLSVPLGILAASECPWAFGDDNCKFNVAAVTETGTISAVNGHEITVTGLSGTATTNERYFHHGYVERNGIKIMVREHVLGNSMELMKRPPAEWDGNSLTLVPGCDKELETCQSLWSNEDNFCGIGIGMPGHHPLIETI